MSTAQTYNFLNGAVSASFDHPGAIRPEDAVAFLTGAIEDAGGLVTTGFLPDEQENRGDPGYLQADFRIELPGGRRLWVALECPTDDAC